MIRQNKKSASLMYCAYFALELLTVQKHNKFRNIYSHMKSTSNTISKA